MDGVIVSVASAAILAVAGALYRLGSTIGVLNTTVQGIESDLRDSKVTLDGHERRINRHGDRITALEVRISPSGRAR